jgi:hypothetical protein
MVEQQRLLLSFECIANSSKRCGLTIQMSWTILVNFGTVVVYRLESLMKSSSFIARYLALLSLITSSLLTGCGWTSSQTTGNTAQPVSAAPTMTLYAAGDIAECRLREVSDTMASRTAERIATELATDSTARVLTLGDNAYPNGSADDYAKCYDPTWGRFKARTLPSPGNHEYHTPSATGYFDYFGALAGPQRRGYYSADIGAWHVISLNSNLNGAAQQAQLDWLKSDLAARPAGCALAFWHHPVFSSGGHGNNAVMREAWRLLAAAGTDLVLSGHDHDYERFAPQDIDGNVDPQHGMRQFVIGSGGAQLTPLLIRRANSDTADNTSYGILKLTLNKTGYVWDFLPVANGSYTDHGTATCHATSK